MFKLFNLITDKPHFGFAMAGDGFVSGLLTWLHVITSVLGCIGAFFGCLAGFSTLLIKWREYRAGK